MEVKSKPAFGINLYIEETLGQFVATSQHDSKRLAALTKKALNDGVQGDAFFRAGEVPFLELIGKVENTGKTPDKDIQELRITTDIEKMENTSPVKNLIDMIELGYNHVHGVLTGKIDLWK